MSVTTAARNASMEDLVRVLQDQHGRKIDMVLPASKVRSEGGVLVVEGADAVIDAEGVTQADGLYLPTEVCDEGVADKLGIPLTYVRRMRSERVDLYDANVNGWLHGGPGGSADSRKFLLRGFAGDTPGAVGIGRALLSDSFKRMDNLDILMATLAGVKEAGVNVVIEGCDLTERRMRVRIVAPEVQALAPILLNGYRSPFDGEQGVPRAGTARVLDQLATARRLAGGEGKGYEPGQEPIVFAGFEVSNSETGGGAFTITPRLVVKACRNGLTVTWDVLRAIHVGSKMDEGVVVWSAETEAKNLALVTSKAKDAVATFLDADYVARTVSRIEDVAGFPLSSPAEDVKRLGKSLMFDEATTEGILDHFIRGGQVTAGGLVNAITSYSQTVEDADKAAGIEASALKVLDLVG